MRYLFVNAKYMQVTTFPLRGRPGFGAVERYVYHFAGISLGSSDPHGLWLSIPAIDGAIFLGIFSPVGWGLRRSNSLINGFISRNRHCCPLNNKLANLAILIRQCVLSS